MNVDTFLLLFCNFINYHRQGARRERHTSKVEHDHQHTLQKHSRALGDDGLSGQADRGQQEQLHQGPIIDPQYALTILLQQAQLPQHLYGFVDLLHGIFSYECDGVLFPPSTLGMWDLSFWYNWSNLSHLSWFCLITGTSASSLVLFLSTMV